MVEYRDKEEYIALLEEELAASIEREKMLSEANLTFSGVLKGKIKRTGFYKKLLANPKSKVGKVFRAPRTIVRLIKDPSIKDDLFQKKTEKIVNLDTLKNKNILDPWNTDVQDRKKIALDAIKAGRKLVLYYVEKPDASTFRYRCYNTFEITKDSKKWQAVYFSKKELDTIKELAPKSSLLIIGREFGDEKDVIDLIDLARSKKIKIGYDIDDLVFDKKYLDVVTDTIGGSANMSYWISYFNKIHNMAERVDFYIATNEFLADKLKDSFNRPCAVIRNSVNQGQLSASMVYVARKKESDEFKIGYFSGSPTHAKDFAEAEPELMKFLSNHANAVLNVVGYMDFSKDAEKLIKKKQIRFLPPVDFRKLQRLMSEVDVNIAPLVINDFTNCKSELKFFEAALVETTTIASPTYTFKNAIKDGENGFLAKPGEWYKKLEYLYEHSDKNKEIAMNAKKYVLKNYSGSVFLKEVENAYDKMS